MVLYVYSNAARQVEPGYYMLARSYVRNFVRERNGNYVLAWLYVCLAIAISCLRVRAMIFLLPMVAYMHVVCANNFLKYKRKLHVEKISGTEKRVHFQPIHVSEPPFYAIYYACGFDFTFTCSALSFLFPAGAATPSRFTVTVGIFFFCECSTGILN